MQLMDYIKFDGPASYKLEDIKVWLEQHQDKTIYELSEAAKRSPQRVRSWRNVFGLNKPNPFHDPKKQETMRRKKLQKGIIPNSVDKSKIEDHEWMHEKFINQKWTKLDIASVCGVRNIDVHNKLVEHGLFVPNACKNKEWLYEYYIRRKLSTVDCAKIAGVYPYTIQLWLYRFGLETRMDGEATGARGAIPITITDQVKEINVSGAVAPE
jgi:hypothetical protein